MSGENTYTLKLGESAKVRPGILRASVSVIYTGMISADVYSVAVTWTSGNNSMAYNLYFPKHRHELLTPKGHIEIDYVSTDEIRFSYFDD
ncbi:MAG: hypothetical protein JW995_07340 [Melioribacteraceae bacterium]|nr:hypothetical protein [Melioribacteraceae bacterium]